MFSVRQLDLVLDAQGVVPGRPRRLPSLRPQGLVIRGGCNVVATERVNFLFADARSLYDGALEMLAQGATKRATDALVLARHGEEPQSAGQARRALLRPSTLGSHIRRVSGPLDGFQGH